MGKSVLAERFRTQPMGREFAAKSSEFALQAELSDP
jgi:hypothetical protein